MTNPYLTNSPPVSNTDPINNPLRAYRSYSYHWIMIATDNTNIFDIADQPDSGLDPTSDPDFYVRPVGNDRRAIKEGPKGTGPYSILIDGRVDTDFIIQEVEFGTTFVGATIDQVAPSDTTASMNTYASDGKLTIVEPRGCNFVNLLARLGDTNYLNVDVGSMYFLLKVIFIGQKDDGTVEQVTNIPPFGVVLTDFSGTVDENGTTYVIPFSNVYNGQSWNKSYDAMVDNIHFTFRQKESLATHLARFTTQLNEKYEADRLATVANLKKAGFDTSQMSKLLYTIKLDDSGGDVIA